VKMWLKNFWASEPVRRIRSALGFKTS